MHFAFVLTYRDFAFVLTYRDFASFAALSLNLEQTCTAE